MIEQNYLFLVADVLIHKVRFLGCLALYLSEYNTNKRVQLQKLNH
jgi:hypothetical protein